MNAFDRKFRQFIDRLTHWWSNSGKPAGQKGIEGAAAKARDLRETDTAKKAEAKLSDLRGTDTAKKAEAKLADLRQREPVKKAEETARKALHDLFSGSKSDTSSEG